MTKTITPAAESKSPPMFLLVPVRRAWWPVTFSGVTEDGEVIENSIKMQFRLVDEDEVQSFYGRANEIGAEAAEKALPFSTIAATFLAEIVDDWSGVGQPNKEPAPFTIDNFAALLRIPNVFPAVIQAYGACRRAEPDTRTKN